MHPSLLKLFSSTDATEQITPSRLAKLEGVAWFGPWVKFHARICHHKSWLEPNQNPNKQSGWAWLLGWAEHFAALRISSEEAYAATRRLQLRDYGYAEAQMRTLCDIVLEIRKEQRMSTAQKSRAAQSIADRDELELNDRAKCRWNILSPVQKAARLKKIYDEHPHMKHIPRFAEAMAIQQMADDIQSSLPDQAKNQQPRTA
jgi:hypothetical protein